jgi:hypothetical protein
VFSSNHMSVKFTSVPSIATIVFRDNLLICSKSGRQVTFIFSVWGILRCCFWYSIIYLLQFYHNYNPFYSHFAFSPFNLSKAKYEVKNVFSYKNQILTAKKQNKIKCRKPCRWIWCINVTAKHEVTSKPLL